MHGLRLPPPEIARVDTGVRQGDAVTPFYDPMIAKIIVWGEDRAAALGRLRRALADTAVLGVVTNLDFLARVAAHPEFAAAEIDTGFIERHRAALIPPRTASARGGARRGGARRGLLARDAAARAAAAGSGDPFSPWARTDGWRLERIERARSSCFATGPKSARRGGQSERRESGGSRSAIEDVLAGWRATARTAHSP